MKPFVFTILIVAVSLLMIGASLVLLGDDSVFTTPPELVVEDFMKEMALGRYERARPFLEDHVEERATAPVLQGLEHRLRNRLGTILDVSGEPVWKRGRSAVAAARVESDENGTVLLRFPLRFESGVWRITGLGDLADTLPAARHGDETLEP